MKVYQGFRAAPTNAGEETIVLVDGMALPLEPSLKLCNHSPDGFEWGYGGSGPAQLALAILIDCLGDQERALRLYQDFKWRVVARWPQESGWNITENEILDTCEQLEDEWIARHNHD
jgi:hypothetical protein